MLCKMSKKIHEIILNFNRSKNIFLGLLFILFLGSNKIVAQADNCAATPTLTVGTTCVTTNYNVVGTFTESGVTASCGTSLRDGWFTFTTDATTTLISVTGTSNRRLGLAIYSGACGTLTEVACTIPNAANASLTSISVSPSTTYRLRLMRTNGPNTNDMTGTICVFKAAPVYCTPTNTYSTSYYISGVTTAGGVANISNTGTGFSAYTDYSSQFVSQFPGSSFSLTATHPSSTYGYNVWVDWNNDGDFVDAGENVISTGYLSTPASLGTITVPPGQAPGNYRMRIRNAFLSNPAPACGSFDYGEAEDYTIQVITPAACSGTPTAGTTTTSPVSGSPGSSYTVSATGFSSSSGLTFQWQYSTNGGATWTNAGASSGTYSNYIATAPALGVVTNWHLIVTCTSSGLSATSSSATFTSVSTINVPATGNNTVTCGTNITLYDNGGSAGNYANSSNGYTVLEAGLGATITISGSYVTESVDYIRLYSGVGTSGTLLATYSGSSGGTINYTGTAGQTITVQFTSDGSVVYSGFSLSVTYSGVCFPACSGTPTGGTVITSPVSGSPGSSYTVSATGYTGATGLTFQWQYSTNGGATWTNAGASSGTYSNYTATAPALGVVTNWHLIVTCTNSGLSATSSSAIFTSVSTLNVPATGNNTVSCGTNVLLYDNGGSAGDYANSSDGYTVLQAGAAAIINISGNYTTESIDYIRIYDGTGTGGTLLATYSGSSGGTINYTGLSGQTLTIRFSSDSSLVYSGFALSITYSGACTLTPCTGTPNGGTVTTNPNTGWPGSSYTVSATGYEIALNLTYQWQYSTDGGATWTNAGASSGTYSNYTATAPASGDVLWHLLITCANSGQTGTSSTGTFVTMAVSPVGTGCPNVVSGGLGLSGADPAAITCISPSGCVDLEATYLDLGDTSSYIVEPITYNPPFAFSGLANPVSVSTDDVWSPLINLPFDFCFYGNSYNQCTIGSNGVLSFDIANAGTSSGYSFSNSLPSTVGALFANSIYGVYHDINPGIGGEVGWELITLATGCRALVASWSNVPLFGDNTQFYTGMMVLYENSNVIEVYIQNKPNDPGNWNGNNAIVGIQNSTGTLASVAPGRNGLDTDWTATNEAWRFVPNGTSIASVKWYEGSGVSGTVVGTTDIINVCPSITTIYTAEITYTLCNGSTITELDETTVTVNKDKTWDGSTSTNWNTASNWTPSGVPLITESVYIPNVANDPIIGAGADALACSLNIDAGAVLTLSSGRNMVVTNAITVAAGGTFNVMNSANLVQVNDASINSGEINMERITNVRLQDYSYWSSPVGSFPVQSVSPATPAGYIFEWQTTAANPNGGEGYWVNTSENMIPAKGYILRAPSGFSNAATSALTANFIGVPNNGIFSPTIYRGTNYTGLGTQGILRTITDDNWNLIGNPYPSALGVNEFLTLPANSSIVGGLRVWTHGQLPTNAVDPFYQDFVTNYYPSDYVIINLTGATSGPGDPTIGAGQSFMVLMDAGAAGSSNVTFNNSMRGAGFTNNVFYRNSNTTTNHATNTIEQNRIWLDLVAPTGAVNRMLVGYVTDATQAEDRLYDSFTDYKPSQNFYSLIGNDPMAIQGRALPFDVNDLVNLGVTIPQDGVYSIAISALDGLFETTNQNIYIEDLENNIIHSLRDMPYSFMATAGNITNRFVLRYTDSRLGNDDLESLTNNVWVVANDNLSVKSTSIEIKSVTIHDVLGRVISVRDNVNSNEVSFGNIQKNNTTLLVKIQLTNGAIVNKKVIY
jgi:hypothetical protein